MGTAASTGPSRRAQQNGIYSKSAYGSIWKVWVSERGAAMGIIVHA